MHALVAEMQAAHHRELVAVADRERVVTRLLRARRAERRAQRAAGHAARAYRRATDARIALG